jgi:hypothetical protein
MRKFVFGGSFLGIPPLDPDAVAFLTAAGITDPTIETAIDTLVKDLKTANIWAKMKAIYPFVGGTASAHKWNLKNPSDTDAAFRLVFSGGWTHSATGAKPNGTNAYADTFLVGNTLSQNNTHLSYYSRTNASENGTEIGLSPVFGVGLYLIFSYSGSGFKSFYSAQTNRGSIFTPTTGLLIGSRISSTQEKYYHKGNLIDTLNVSSQNNIDSGNIYLGKSNNSNNWSSKESAFASIGDGLTDTEAANFYTAVQLFQTTLSRNV